MGPDEPTTLCMLGRRESLGREGRGLFNSDGSRGRGGRTGAGGAAGGCALNPLEKSENDTTCGCLCAAIGLPCRGDGGGGFDCVAGVVFLTTSLSSSLADSMSSKDEPGDPPALVG